MASKQTTPVSSSNGQEKKNGEPTNTEIKNENLDNTKQSDSDERFTCEACVLDGVEKSASAFCVDCQDYLCSDCSRHHCLPKPMKNHKILPGHEMPKRKASTSLSEDCAKHKGETIKFYCKKHNDVGCHICIVTIHRTCGNVYALTDLTKDIEHSQLYSETKKELKEMEESFKAQNLRIYEKDQLSRQCYKTVFEEVKRRRKEMNQQFDKLEQGINAESAKVCRENIANMKPLTETCTAKLVSIEKIKSDLQLLEETNQEKQLFIALKKAELQVGEMKSALLKIKAKTQVRKVKLLPNTISKSILVREDTLGHLQVCGLQDDMHANSEDVYEQIGINKLLEMSPDTTIATDYQRCQVCLYDKNFHKIHQVKLATGPWDMTKTSKDIVAVTLPHEKKIKFLFISNTIQEVGQMPTPGHCKGIAAVNNKLVVTFSNPAGLKILNDHGVVRDIRLNTFIHLQEPAYVAVDEDKNIFVTDPVHNTVVKLNEMGCFKSVCRSIEMPLHICVCCENVLVSECESVTVHILSRDFTKHEAADDLKDIFSTGDVSISSAGVAFHTILKVKDQDAGMPYGLPNVRYINNRRGNTDTADKKCIIS